MLLAPLACWLLATRAGGVWEVLLLLAAPLLVSALVPLQAPLGPRLAASALALTLALVPLARSLGPGWPSPRTGVVVAGALATPVLLFLTAPGAALSASDLATGTLTLGLAAGLGLVSLLAAPSR